MELAKISNYGNYSSSNYGAHSLRVDIGSLTLWFSYKTIVAFQNSSGRKVTQNQWGPTTGKHLNWIDGYSKRERLPPTQFEAELREVLKSHNLS